MTPASPFASAWRASASRRAWHEAMPAWGHRPAPDCDTRSRSCSWPGRRRSRHHLKWRLLREGLKENRCEECGITEWRDKPLNMALHHVNGDGRTTGSRTSDFCARTATPRRPTTAGATGIGASAQAGQRPPDRRPAATPRAEPRRRPVATLRPVWARRTYLPLAGVCRGGRARWLPAAAATTRRRSSRCQDAGSDQGASRAQQERLHRPGRRDLRRGQRGALGPRHRHRRKRPQAPGHAGAPDHAQRAPIPQSLTPPARTAPPSTASSPRSRTRSTR